MEIRLTMLPGVANFMCIKKEPPIIKLVSESESESGETIKYMRRAMSTLDSLPDFPGALELPMEC